MNIHTIFDDNFFSLGCEAILKSNGYQANSINFKELQYFILYGKIQRGDVALVAMSSHTQTLKALKFLSDIGVEVILIADLPNKKYFPMSWLDVLLSKRMDVNFLISHIENPTLNIQKSIKPLTGREKEIMENILTGYSIEEISSSLRISIKTVYSHRRNSLKKIGLDHAKSFLFVGYQDYFTKKDVQTNLQN